jgi:hypothetical protein
MSEDLHQLLIEVATKYIGVKEATNHNDGPEVEMFQKAVDGKANGESWCMGFVQYCIKQVEQIKNIRTNLFSSEHCLTVWNKTDHDMRRTEPQPGYIVIWQHGNTTQGHTGIVTSGLQMDGVTFNTIEGNTGDGSGVVRDGDGVYRRTRSINGAGSMKVLGFIDPFAETVNS